VRTFSRDELRSLFRVDPATACDTHKAIKCSCDSSAAAAAAKADELTRAAAEGAGGDDGGGGVAGKGGGGGGAAEQQGVAAWAHLADAADSPDPTWQHVSAFARSKVCAGRGAL
jgi:hypothetical protein